MSENMVRTQVYLPRDLFNELQRRAKVGKSTLAEEIRSGLQYYLAWTRESKKDTKLPPLNLNLDELLEIIEKNGGSGVSDGAENHDKYIYGDPHGDKSVALQLARAQTKPEMLPVVREGRAAYRTSKRTTVKRKKKRK